MRSPWVWHQSTEPYAYAITETSARLVLLVERGYAHNVTVHSGDRYATEFTDRQDMSAAGCDDRFDYFSTVVDIRTRRLRYAFELQQGEDRLWYGETGCGSTEQQAGAFQLAYLCTRDVFEVPAWVRSAVAYQIFPDRFAIGSHHPAPAGAVPWDAQPSPTDTFGGNLAGIVEHLDDLHQLGVTLLYLTPIFTAGSNHKYDTADYYAIDPQFGTEDDLRQLVQGAHDRGMRVILDAVFNHCGATFQPFQDAIAQGRMSPYWDWFFITGDQIDVAAVNYETFANAVATMPKLNVSNPAVEAYLLEAATHWIRALDIDGWRLDVANEVDHVFWRKFRTAVKTAKPDALVLGEVWHDSLPWLRGDQFDGVMNYLFREACLRFFVHRDLSAQSFAEQLTGLYHRYPEPAQRCMFNLLGSHDTARILTLADGRWQDVALASVFQFTMPGIPMIYYGDEVGMVGGTDPDCRRGMLWHPARQHPHLPDLIRQLAHLKTTEPALGGAGFAFVHADEDVIEFARWQDDTNGASGASVHVAINLGGGEYVPRAHGEVVFVSRPDALREGRLLPGGAAIWRVTDAK